MAGRYKSLKFCKEQGCNEPCIKHRNLCREHYNKSQKEVIKRYNQNHKEKDKIKFSSNFVVNLEGFLK